MSVALLARTGGVSRRWPTGCKVFRETRWGFSFSDRGFSRTVPNGVGEQNRLPEKVPTLRSITRWRLRPCHEITVPILAWRKHSCLPRRHSCRRTVCAEDTCREESRHCTQECVRHKYLTWLFCDTRLVLIFSRLVFQRVDRSRDHVLLRGPIAEIDQLAPLATERHVRVSERDRFFADWTLHR
jgi:hypothetical protein